MERDEQLKQFQLEQLRLTLEKTAEGAQTAVNSGVKSCYNMKSFRQFFVVGGELGLFLTNLKRTCTRMGLEESC